MMKVQGFVAASLAAGALAVAGSPVVAADTVRLGGGVGSFSASADRLGGTVDGAAQQLDRDASAETVQAHIVRRAVAAATFPLHPYAAYRPYYYGGYRPYWIGRPYLGYYRPFYRPYWGGYYGPSIGLALGFPGFSLSVPSYSYYAQPSCLSYSLAAPLTVPAVPTLPPPVPESAPPPRTYQYDGGPRQAVPIPGGAITPPPDPTPPTGNRAAPRGASATFAAVTKPAKKYEFTAYGDEPSESAKTNTMLVKDRQPK